MFWTKSCDWAKAPMTWDYVVGEWKELMVEIKYLHWPGVKDELSDVAYCFELWLSRKTRLNIPMVLAGSTIEKHLGRIDKWEEIFEREGLEFKYDYLAGGSNWEKPYKVVAALKLARKEQRE